MPSDSLKIIKNHLESRFGEIGTKMYQKSISKLNIGDSPSKDDIEKLVTNIKGMITPLYGNDRALEISNELHKNLGEIEKAEIPNDIDKEISVLLANKALPNEKDITDFAKYLTMKYGGNAQKIEKDLIEKIKIHIKAGMSRKKINEEITNFLIRYSEPTEDDVSDFINYIRLSELDFKENELREQIEKERLYRKFHGPQEKNKASELDDLINFVKTSNDKEAISKLIHKQGLSYLIKDDTGVSDKSLSEFIELATPSESDMKNILNEIGLDHLINKKE